MNVHKIAGFAVGPVVSSVLGVVTLPVTTWIFSPADVGRLNVLQITLAFSVLLTVLGLDQAYVREYHETKDRGRLLLSCFAPGFTLLVVVAMGSSFCARDLAYLLFADDAPWLYWITLLACFSSYVSRFLSLILRMEERGWAYSASHILPRTIQLVLIVALALTAFPKRFIHLQLIAFASLLSVMLLLAWNTRKQWLGALGKRLEKDQVKSLLGFGAPLIFSGLAYWGLMATGTIALRTWSNWEELAVYSVARSFAGAAIVLQSIFSVVWAPTVYKWVAQGVDMTIVDRVARQALAIVCVLVALCGSFSWLCDWVLPARYAEVKYILVCMLMPPLLYTLSEITCVGINIQRRTIWSLWITLGAMLVNMTLSLVLVPRHGAAGAAVANAAAFGCFFLGRTEVSARIWRAFPRTRLYVYICGLVVLAGLMAASPGRASIPAHSIWAVLLALALYSFRAQWRELTEMFQRRKSPLGVG